MSDYDDPPDKSRGTTRRKFLGAATALTGLTGLTTISTGATTDEDQNAGAIKDKMQRDYNAAVSAQYQTHVEEPDLQLHSYSDDPWAAVGIELHAGSARFVYEMTDCAAEQFALDILDAVEDANAE